MTNTIAVDETAKGEDVMRKTTSQKRKKKNLCERVRLRVKVENSHVISEGESWISRWCHLHCPAADKTKLSKGTMKFGAWRLSFESRCLLHSLWTFFALQKSSCLLIDISGLSRPVEMEMEMRYWRAYHNLCSQFYDIRVRSKCTMNLRLVKFVR